VQIGYVIQFGTHGMNTMKVISVHCY